MQKMNKTMSKYTGINRLLKSEAIQSVLDRLENGSIGEFVEDWRWIFGYSRKYKWIIIVYTMLGILSSTLGLGTAVLTKYMIDIVVNRKVDQVWVLAFLIIFGSVFRLVFSSVVSRLSTKISIYVNNDIQADIFEKIMDSDWLCLSSYSSGDLLNRFSNDIKSVASNAVNWLPDLLIQIYTFVATLAVLCYYDRIMAVIAFLSAPILMFSAKFILKNMQSRRKKVLEVNSDMISFQSETFYNYDTLKSFGIVQQYCEKLKIWQKKYADSNLDYNLFTIRSSVWMQIQTMLVGLAAFSYCLFRLWTDSITYGTMTLFLQQRSKLSSNFESLVKVLPNMVNSAVAAHRVREIAELPKEQHYKEAAEELESFARQGMSVRLKNVGFSYIEGHPVLKHSDLVARPNEIIALVGPSGEGKTTILRMLLGLIRPESGDAVLETAEGREIVMNADMRELFSYVPQGNTMFSGNITENMRLVRENATDEEIIEALKIACAWEFVEKLDQGIYGKLGERGKGVSEGQAQRIAIARAILRDAPILLLDEATSALDIETEQRVLKNIMKQRPNKTCIVSTHRLSVLGMCQRVYRIVDGKITEIDPEKKS